MDESLKIQIKLLNDQFKKSAKESKKEISGIKEEVNKTRESCDELNRQKLDGIKTSLKTLKLAVVAAAIAIGGAIQKSIKDTISLGDNIDKASQKANMSVKTYQQWGYILDLCGSDISSLQIAMRTLTKTQADAIDGNKAAIETFSELGISTKELTQLKPEELFALTTKQLQNMSNTTQRTQIAMKLMGRAGTELNTVFNLSNGETEQLRQKYEALGGTMSRNLVQTTAQVKDAITDLKIAWQGVTNTLAEYFLPMIKEAVEWLTMAAIKASQFLKIVFGISANADSQEIAPTQAVSSYVEEVEDAQTETKKLLTLIGGFDELNILQSQKDISSYTPNNNSGSGLIDNGFEDTLKPTKENYELSDKWTKIAQTIHDHFDDILKLAGDIGLAILAWKLSSTLLGGIDSLKDLKIATGITLLVTGIKPIIDAGYDAGKNGFTDESLIELGFGTLASAIGAGLLFGPWGVAFSIPLSFIVSGISFLEGYYADIRERYENSELRKEIQQLRDDIEQNTLDSLKLIARIENITGEINPEDLAKIDMLKTKIYVLFKMDSKDNKTAQEIKKIQSLCDEINQTNLLPFTLEYDKATGHINKTKEAIDEVIESILKQYKVEALKDAIVEAYKAEAEAADIAKTAENKLHDAKVKHSEAIKDATAKTEAYYRAMDKLNEYSNYGMSFVNIFSEDFKELNNAVWETRKEMKAANMVVDDAIQGVDEAQAAVDLANTAMQTAKDKVNSLEKELRDLTNEANNSTKSVNDYSKSLEKVPKKIKIEIEQNIKNTGDELMSSSQNNVKNTAGKPIKQWAFAEGAVVHQPTLAMVGEYSGASSNPEIVTPESKMRNIFAESNNELSDVFIDMGRQIVQAIKEQDLNVNIGDDQIARSAARGNNAYKNRTGVSLITI